MQEFIKIIIGILFLIFGYFIGNFLAKIAKDELESGQKWFKILVWIGLIGGFLGLILGSDVLLFAMFFIALISSRSLKNKREIKKR